MIIMQTRLLACISGGLFGVVAAYTVNERMTMSPIVTFTGCILAGIALGYFVSIMIDVFTADTGTPE
jgi:ABC-type Fe3+-siderophore transport system permease subunit